MRQRLHNALVATYRDTLCSCVPCVVFCFRLFFRLPSLLLFLVAEEDEEPKTRNNHLNLNQNQNQSHHLQPKPTVHPFRHPLIWSSSWILCVCEFQQWAVHTTATWMSQQVRPERVTIAAGAPADHRWPMPWTIHVKTILISVIAINTLKYNYLFIYYLN